MIHYIVQTIVFQLLFLIVYDLFLKKETFFTTNRVYLLVTPLLSFLLPLIEIAAIRESIPSQYVIQLPAVMIGESSPALGLEATSAVESIFSLPNLWIVGGCLSLLFFGYKLSRIFTMKRKGSLSKFEKFNIIRLPGTTVAFTFFRNIFLGADLSEAQQKNILLHEKVHVVEYHTADLLFFEVLRILFWFNPMVYVYQKRMTVLQEYIADRHVAANQSRKEYYQDLLSQIFGTSNISFVNSFFNHSLIKNRIIMLQKSNSKRVLKLKYLLVIPMVLGMLFYTSCSDGTDANALKNEANLESSTDTEVMNKINELSEAIMKKGNLTDDEMRALKFLATEAQPGDKIYESVTDFLNDSISFSEEREPLTDIPYAVIGKAPVFPECDGMTNEAGKKCTSKMISDFVAGSFNTKLANTTNLEGRQRISVQFKIDKTGQVTNVKARAAHPVLEEEAIRLVQKLPKMIPGEHKGKAVSVIYSLPIVFVVE